MSADGRLGYVGIDRSWLADQRLSDGDLRLMLWLTSHTDTYLNRLHAKAVAEQMGWSRNRVSRSLEALEALGLISTEQIADSGAGARTKTKITLHMDAWSENPRASRQSTAVLHDGTHPVLHDGARSTSTPNGEESTLETPQPPSMEVASLPIEAEVFHRFWLAYPRKTGKPAAVKAFRAAMKKHDVQEIADGFQQWAIYWQEAGTEEQFIPHPSTFLNQERYCDRPPAIAMPTTKAGRSMAVIEQLARGEL